MYGSIPAGNDNMLKTKFVTPKKKVNSFITIYLFLFNYFCQVRQWFNYTIIEKTIYKNNLKIFIFFLIIIIRKGGRYEFKC